MSCGNEGDEGEAARTWNSLLVAPYLNGYTSATWKETSVYERTIRDFSASFSLDDLAPLGSGCKIDIAWENTNFLPSWIEVDGVTCTTPSTSTSSAACYLSQKISSNLVIGFKDTLVQKTVSETAEGGEETAYFMSRAHSYGNWNTDKYVYKCRNLNTGTDDCGTSVDSADFLVTVKA
jgi:hypothetical protein